MPITSQLPPANLIGTLDSYQQLTQAQTQISSGKNAQRIGDSPDAAQDVMVYSAQRQWAENKVTLLEANNIDASVRSSSIDQILESATRITTLIVGANTGANGPNNSFLENMNQELTTIFELLNVKNDNGDYLFAGTALNTPPADRSQLLNPPTTGSTADFSWFKGLNDTPITANNAGIEMLLRGAQMAYNTSMGPPPDSLRLSNAMSLVNQGLQTISDTIFPSSINAVNTIESNITSWTDEQNNSQLQIDQEAQTDILTKLMEIQQRSVQLQGDFISQAEIRSAMKFLIDSVR